MKKTTFALALLAALAALPTGPASGTGGVVQQNVRHITTVPGATGGHSVVEGNRLYVGAYGLGMRIFDITNPAAPVEIGHYYGAQSNTPSNTDPGARADAVPDATVINGRHIATLNGTNRATGTQQTEFLDVTNPATPQLLWRLGPGPVGEAHNGDIVDGRNLWLPSGGGVGLRIYDLMPLLETPPQAPRVLFSQSPHVLWQDSKYRGAKAVGPAFNHIHDLEVYKDYNLLLHESEWVDQDGDEIPDPTYDDRDIALLAASQGYSVSIQGVQTTPNNTATYIIDITDPANPVAINKIHSLSGHTIRYLHEAQLLDSDPHVMFTSDEDLHNGCEAGGLTSYRLSDDLATATKLDEWYNGTGTPAPVCSSHVFSSHGPYVFMGSYNAGLQVIDFSDPANLTRAGQYIAPGMNSWGALYHAGYVYVGDFGARGLDVFQFIAKPVREGVTVPNPSATTVSGVNETLCENGQTGAPDVDALAVPIPADKRDGTHEIRAVGSPPQPYDLNVYFHDESCAFMSGVSLNSTSADELGAIPEGAAWAFVTNVLGAPTRTWAQIDPFL